MHAYINSLTSDRTPDPFAEAASELARWFSVSGDLDDFIYYGEEPSPSEK